MHATPRIALTCGDPSGVGPEIVLAALADEELRETAAFVVIGPASLRPADLPAVPREAAHCWSADLGPGAAVWIETAAPPTWEMGRIQEPCGRAALAALRVGHELALAGQVDALVTAPVSKEALHLAGAEVEGQTELLGRWCGVDDHQMLAVAGELRVLLLTRHLPLHEALGRIEGDEVLRHLQLLHDGLEQFGHSSPRLALAGLNPHAGEGGILGTEEREVLAPAVERARAGGLDVTGPVSPDAVFARGAAGEFDGVLALYHDQAFIPIKLLGEGRGLTVLLGLPYLRLSPAHGVAFDIAGRGRARSLDLRVTIRQAIRWSRAGKGVGARP